MIELESVFSDTALKIPARGPLSEQMPPLPLRIPTAVARALEQREALVVRLEDAAGGRAFVVELAGLPLYGSGSDLQAALDHLEGQVIQALKVTTLVELKRQMAEFDPAQTYSRRRPRRGGSAS